MRLIHTADWHLGNSMHDIDRTEEVKAFFQWLRNEIIERGAEGLVVAGDVFDNRTPSNSVKKLYYEFLASLLGTDCRNVIIVGGNHDSGAMLDTTRELSEALNIHVVGSISERSTEELIYELQDKNGTCSAICAAVPFVREFDLRRYCTEDCEDKTFSDRAYSALYGEVLEEAERCRGDRKIPLITTGHLYAAALEGRYGEMESDEEVKTDDGLQPVDVMGKLGKVHVDVFPPEFSYVALGHIHYSTRVAKQNRIRYSGSPFVMGFDEAKIPHYILQIDLEETAEAAPKVEMIEVPRYDRYERLSGTKEEIIDGLQELARSVSDRKSGSVYVEICYRPEDRTPLNEAVEELKLSDEIRVVSWKLIRAERTAGSTLGDYSMQEMKHIDFEEVVRSLILSKFPVEKEEGMTEEDVRRKEEEVVSVYLPYFLEAYREVQIGGEHEDN